MTIVKIEPLPVETECQLCFEPMHSISCGPASRRIKHAIYQLLTSVQYSEGGRVANAISFVKFSKCLVLNMSVLKFIDTSHVKIPVEVICGMATT